MSPKLLISLFLCAGLFVSEIGFAQEKVVKGKFDKRINIAKIAIKDTVLIKYLREFISEQSRSDSLFKNKGYILVSPIRVSQKQSVAKGYHINKNYMSFDNLENDKQFPMFYSFLANKMILFLNFDHFETFDIRYTRKSKLRFRKELEPYLFEARTIEFNEGNSKYKFMNFRENEVFQMGGGIDVYIMTDGRIVVEAFARPTISKAKTSVGSTRGISKFALLIED